MVSSPLYAPVAAPPCGSCGARAVKPLARHGDRFLGVLLWLLRVDRRALVCAVCGHRWIGTRAEADLAWKAQLAWEASPGVCGRDG